MSRSTAKFMSGQSVILVKKRLVEKYFHEIFFIKEISWTCLFHYKYFGQQLSSCWEGDSYPSRTGNVAQERYK